MKALLGLATLVALASLPMTACVWSGDDDPSSSSGQAGSSGSSDLSSGGDSSSSSSSGDSSSSSSSGGSSGSSGGSSSSSGGPPATVVGTFTLAVDGQAMPFQSWSQSSRQANAGLEFGELTDVVFAGAGDVPSSRLYIRIANGVQAGCPGIEQFLQLYLPASSETAPYSSPTTNEECDLQITAHDASHVAGQFHGKVLATSGDTVPSERDLDVTFEAHLE